MDILNRSLNVARTAAMINTTISVKINSNLDSACSVIAKEVKLSPRNTKFGQQVTPIKAKIINSEINNKTADDFDMMIADKNYDILANDLDSPSMNDSIDSPDSLFYKIDNLIIDKEYPKNVKNYFLLLQSNHFQFLKNHPHIYLAK